MKIPYSTFSISLIISTLPGLLAAMSLPALLDQDSPFNSLPEAQFRALGTDLALPDGGATVSALARAAPGGAFDPRDLEKIEARKLGYKPTWLVTRYPFYNLSWDITGLRLDSLHPDADQYPWMVIINGGSANFYEFFIDLKNNPQSTVRVLELDLPMTHYGHVEAPRQLADVFIQAVAWLTQK